VAIAVRIEDADALLLQKEREETDKYILRGTEHGRANRKLINIRLWEVEARELYCRRIWTCLNLSLM
jgi:hypothetical protein